MLFEKMSLTAAARKNNDMKKYASQTHDALQDVTNVIKDTKPILLCSRWFSEVPLRSYPFSHILLCSPFFS